MAQAFTFSGIALSDKKADSIAESTFFICIILLFNFRYSVKAFL